MNDSEKIEMGEQSPQPKHGKPVSVESVVLMFGLFSAVNDREVLERGVKLALRSPNPLGKELREFVRSKGENIEAFLGAEASTPSSMAEVLALADPALKRGVEMAVGAQMADIYLFNTERSPENLVYALYNGVRFAVAQEHKPTKKQSKQIWYITLLIAQNSKVGSPHWKKLKKESPVALKHWLEPIKENARKRYKTFLIQKRRAEATAEKAFRSLMSDIFRDDEEAL